MTNTSLKVVILGSGDTHGTPMMGCHCKTCETARALGKPHSRTRFSVLIQVDQNNILIDCGPDIRQQLLDAQIDRIDAIFLTHPHYDHVCGLGEFYDNGENLNVYGLSTTLDYILNIRDMGYVSCNPRPIEVSREIELHGLSFRAFRVQHRLWDNHVPVGFTISHGNAKIVISGDTNLDIPNESLSLIQSPSILLADALAEKIPVYLKDSHMTIGEAILLGETTQASKVVLYHMSHACPPHNELQERVTALNSKAIVGYDGCKLQHL